MKTLYTAVGRYQNTAQPMVIIHNREYAVDMQELILWFILTWQILSPEELMRHYQQKLDELGCTFSRTAEECVQRLLQRGLIQEGVGDTDADALYDMLSELCIRPIAPNPFMRVLSFVHMLLRRVPLKNAGRILRYDRRTAEEQKVFRLSHKALLSTAEIIRCVDKEHLHWHTEAELVDILYHDADMTFDTIASTSRYLPKCRPVLSAAANLYLRRQIIWERI